MTCMFYNVFSPSPLLLTLLPFISRVFTYGGRIGDISRLIYLKFCSTLRSQTACFISPSFDFVSLPLRNMLFQKPWFLAYKNARKRPPFSKQSSGGFMTLQKVLVVFDIQLPCLPQTLSLSPHAATCFGASIWMSEELKTEKSENVQQSQCFFFLLKLQHCSWNSFTSMHHIF